MKNLTAAFRRAVASFLPPPSDKVVLSVDEVARMIELTSKTRYHHDSKAHLFVMNACRLPPSVRMDNGFVRSFYANPRHSIPVKKPAAQFLNDHDDEYPETIRSSAALMVLDRDISRWSRGLHIVVRGALRDENDPAVLLALSGKYDKKTGDLTIQRLYTPTFEGQRLTGSERVAVTEESVTAALRFIALSFQQMNEAPAHTVWPWHNYRKTFGTPARPAPRP